MTQPKTPITVFEKIRQQIELPGPAAAPGAAAAMFAEFNVPAFLETQAASMRTAGFRAAAELVEAGTHVSLSWVPQRDAAPDAPEARLDIRVVEGSNRPFRARFIYQAFDGQREVAGVCAQYMDAALLNRWFAHFTELCLTAQAQAAEHPAGAAA
ncbi:hypothetical protein [Methylibium petroleiphilum]|uniref:Uncharacterized protein n=1 Tax=Methylibium petroleiphilum (strain ATCC BAA-1232 / LMG 22953 / PM1) TaxID=420662 RepID=A2SMW1_METPP|nr:hypothetical protein [Methylibium petroleiphilum]ABM96900.1 hypothetical protein Mpe_B0121 [Methylibium petroleiphilum PM1]